MSVETPKKNQIYWKQRYRSLREETYKTNDANVDKLKIKNSLKYYAYLQNSSESIKYTNIDLLKVFLTKYGKIKSRRKTRVTIAQQRQLGKAIKKARVMGLLPYTCLVKDIKKDKKRDRKQDLRLVRK